MFHVRVAAKRYDNVEVGQSFGIAGSGKVCISLKLNFRNRYPKPDLLNGFSTLMVEEEAHSPLTQN